jgi:hypothetical protein
MTGFQTPNQNRRPARYVAVLIGCLFAASGCAKDDDASDVPVVEIPGQGDGFQCSFTNPFSQEAECKQYTGAGWTESTVIADCEAGQYNQPGMLSRGLCALTPTLGTCTIGDPSEQGYVLNLGGNNPDFCSTTARSCVSFLQGTFTASPLCEDQYTPTEPIVSEPFIFKWPTQTCKPPLDGEAEGQGPDGDVCTWNLISGCTEEGRSYYDYGSCDTVRTNRPYYPLPGQPLGAEDDPRLEDESYLQESAWVKSQVEACACICCHTEQAPMGPSKWATDAGTLWTDTMSDTAISLFAGYVDSSALGAFNADDNNGFNRLESALPTTDVTRMIAFFETEFQRREIDVNFAQGIRPIGGPLVEQMTHTPEPCPEGVGINRDGLLSWSSDESARYIYLLEQDANSPGIPPNFDIPAGTLWRIDVPFDGTPVATDTVVYGIKPAGMTQSVPAQDVAPPSLTSGTTYYFYVLQDVATPIVRCLFTTP